MMDQNPVRFDSRSFWVRGKRQWLISGEIHYSRSPREQWAALLDRSVACGLNMVATYVFWNWHEPERDRFDFTGDHDVRAFLDLCAERNLAVLLRLGPYCCGEWNFGGYPAWLRDEPGITIRTWNEAYVKRVETYFRRLCAEVRPCLATRGGPVILCQVENEYANVAGRYGEEGARYLAWMADLARNLGLDVPIIMCEGAAEGVIETVNGFSIPDERIAKFRTAHPELPLIWTELWPAWYDTWGFQRHRREARNIARHLLHFVSRGGSGWNYYMWHGGTNFGRTGMYLQTTSYDFDAPLDEYGRITRKGAYMAKLHAALAGQADVFLEGERQDEPATAEGESTVWRLGDRSCRLSLSETGGRLTGSSGEVLFDSEDDWQALEEPGGAGKAALSRYLDLPWRISVPLADWQYWPEPRPSQRPGGSRRLSLLNSSA
jgi:beta-galactosidase